MPSPGSKPLMLSVLPRWPKSSIMIAAISLCTLEKARRFSYVCIRVILSYNRYLKSKNWVSNTLVRSLCSKESANKLIVSKFLVIGKSTPSFRLHNLSLILRSRIRSVDQFQIIRTLCLLKVIPMCISPGWSNACSTSGSAPEAEVCVRSILSDGKVMVHILISGTMSST